jgi:(1->4)-alpha-D-glucan 1-alpha-D-glucosylmutase
VLSEIPREWARALEGWIACSHEDHLGGDQPPDTGDLAILFQTIVGAWPLGLAPDDQSGRSAYAKRIAAWQQKALREAKLRTDWSAPNERYERIMIEFIARLFVGPSDLLNDIAAFARRVAPVGAVNSLAQTLIKLTAPGVPDLYQGTEYWDFSLVDPDNRSPVDFAAREKSLTAHQDGGDLAAQWPNGVIKQWMITRTLATRTKVPELFAEGAYLPLETTGPMARHFAAFGRLSQNSAAIIAFCRFAAELIADDGQLPTLHCTKTVVRIPPELRGTYTDVFGTTQPVYAQIDLQSAQIFGALPVAYLIRVAEPESRA